MLIGVLLAVAAMPVSSKQQKKNTAGEQSEDMQKSVLEEKLEAFLENMNERPTDFQNGLVFPYRTVQIHRRQADIDGP